MFGVDRRKRMIVRAAAVGLGLALAACSSHKSTFQGTPETAGGAGLNLFGNSKADGSEGAVAVNAYLWRASLDTVAFMPLASADPFGGVIISDWFAPPETPDERFKVTVYILGRALRADGLKVSVFRQTRSPQGAWTDATVGPEVATQFEDAVLTRARQLRLQAVNEKG
jgi:hypothetical protein